MDEETVEMETVEEATPEARAKRERATRDEMNQRKEQVIAFIASRPNEAPSTIAEVMEATGLSQIKASTLIRTLIEEGRVQVIGKDGRKLLLRPGTGTPPALKSRVKATPSGERELPRVDVNKVLTQLHIGLSGSLRVAGLHITEGHQPIIDLKTEEGETLTVALVTDAA